MAIELRKSGISVVGDVPWGTHLCHFYETKQDLLDILIPYFKTGLENDEFCMWVVSDPLGEDEARRALKQAVPEADRYLATGHIEIIPHNIFPSRKQASPAGRIEIVPHTEWYLKGGAFVAEQVIDGWNEKLDEALAKGQAGMRANGNPSWLTEENRKNFLEYEKSLDENLSDKRMIVLCSYPLFSSSAAQVVDVVNAHQLAVIRRRGDWEVLEAPELKEAKQEIKRLNEELEERVIERTGQLAAANEQLTATSQQLRALSASLQSAREQESTRIAREIHDELGGNLTSLRWGLEEVVDLISEATGPTQLATLQKKIEAMLTVTETTLDTVRRLASELRPIALDELGLVEAIEWQARQFESRTGIAVQYECPLEKVDLNKEQSTAVFRILQEALTNILRHAQASKVMIAMRQEAGEFVLTIRDNGRGITESEKSGAHSLGLVGMRERALLIGAKVDITGKEGAGTQVAVSIPISIPA